MLKSVFIASVYAVFTLFCTQAYAAETFKSSDFLEWSDGNKSLYIRTTVGTAGLIASYNDKKHQECLETWYISNEEKSNKEIYNVMKNYPDFHPRGVIFAVIRKHCGTFDYSQR